MLFIFSILFQIRYLWQIMTAILLHRYLIKYLPVSHGPVEKTWNVFIIDIIMDWTLCQEHKISLIWDHIHNYLFSLPLRDWAQ